MAASSKPAAPAEPVQRQQQEGVEDDKKPALLLEDGSTAEPTHRIDLSAGGQGSVKLDNLGPLVVHKDGTTSRISNWGEMTQIERDNTLRVLGKRNQLRLEKLRGGEAGADSGNCDSNKTS